MDEVQKKINERWADPESYSRGWARRSKDLVALASSHSPRLTESTVIDLGCGPNMFVRYSLANIGFGGKVVMVDMQSWSPEVIKSDLNFGLPEAAKISNGIYVLSGVLEYILDPIKLITEIGDHADSIYFSYACVNYKNDFISIYQSPSNFSSTIVRRIKSGWASHMSSFDIINRLPKGFRLVDMVGHGDTMSLFAIKRAI